MISRKPFGRLQVCRFTLAWSPAHQAAAASDGHADHVSRTARAGLSDLAVRILVAQEALLRQIITW